MAPAAESLTSRRKRKPVIDTLVAEGIIADTLPMTSPVADNLFATKFFFIAVVFW